MENPLFEITVAEHPLCLGCPEEIERARDSIPPSHPENRELQKQAQEGHLISNGWKIQGGCNFSLTAFQRPKRKLKLSTVKTITGGEGRHVHTEGGGGEGKITAKKSEKYTRNHANIYLSKLHTIHISLFMQTHIHNLNDVIPLDLIISISMTIYYQKIPCNNRYEVLVGRKQKTLKTI